MPASSRVAPVTARRMLNKVPEITLWFWVIKVLCTTVGESAADYLNETLGFGLSNTTYVTGALLIVALVVQFRRPAYSAGIYWLAALVVYSGSNPSFTGIATNHPVPGLPVTASSTPTALGGCLQETGLATLGTNAAPSYTAGVTGIYVYLRVA